MFILPKPSGQAVTAGQTLVAVSLDPPIRKGNTYYSFLLCQFGSDDKMMQELNISDELLAHKNVRVSFSSCAPHCGAWQGAGIG